MKKYLVLIGAAALVLAFASPSLAQAPDWTKAFKTTSLFQIWSVYEPKYEFNNNYGSATASDYNRDLTRRGISSRINFYLEWGDPKYVRGVIGFEADSSDWGEITRGGTDGNAIATDARRANRMGVAGTDQVQLEIKHAYVDFAIPNTPLRLSVGMQGFAIGGRLVQSRDIPGLILSADFAPHKVRAIWWRETDESRTTYHVNDTYGLEYSLTEKLWNFYAYGLYKNDNSDYTLQTAGADTVALKTNLYTDNPYWIGVGGGFRPGNWNFSGQVVFVGGKREFANAALKDPTYSAYAAEILAMYQIGPGLLAGVEGFYSSGRDADSTDKISIYQRPAGSESHSNFGLGRTVFFWMAFGEFGNQHNIQSGIEGFYYLRGNVNYTPLAWLNLNFNYLYIGDNTTGTPGTGIDAATQVSGTKSPNSVGRKDMDKSFVGHELNVIAKIKIYGNHTYNIGLAYFVPGDVFDAPNKTAESAWAFNTGMQLAF